MKSRIVSSFAFAFVLLVSSLSVAVAFVPPSERPKADAQASPAASQPLQTFTGTLCRSYSPPNGKVAVDLGVVNWCFSRSAVSWTDNWTPQHNFTFSIPTVAGFGLTVTTLQNSTTVDYHVTATFSGRTLTGDIFLTARGYSEKITIRGTISGSASTFSLAIPFARVDSVCNTGTICKQVSFSHLSFYWGDATGVTSSYNNATRVLTFTVGNSFSIDPIATDGSANCNSGTGASSCNAALTTTAANDVLIEFYYSNQGGAGCDSTAQTSSPSLTWVLRNNVEGSNQANEMCEFFAVWTSQGAITVTCTEAGNARSACVVFGVSNANINNIWDGGSCTNTLAAATRTTSLCNISTVNANDLLIGAVSIASNVAITAGSGYTLTGSCAISGTAFETCAETQAVTTTASVKAVDFTWASASFGTRNLADAIKQFAPEPVQTKFCTFTAASSPTCAFSSNLKAGDTVLVITGISVTTSTVSSVTDTQSLTYSKIVGEDVATAGDIEGWWACNTGAAAADTITVNWGASLTGIIILYELTPVDSACTVKSSVGQSASSTAPTVAAYTPLNPSLVIGAVNGIAANCGGGCGPGAGYLNDVQQGSGTSEFVSEHATNYATSETTPFIWNIATAYNEISMAFTAATNIITTTTTTTTTTPTTTTTTTSSTTTSTTTTSTTTTTITTTTTTTSTTTTETQTVTTSTTTTTTTTTPTTTTTTETNTTTTTEPTTTTTSTTETQTETHTFSLVQKLKASCLSCSSLSLSVNGSLSGYLTAVYVISNITSPNVNSAAFNQLLSNRTGDNFTRWLSSANPDGTLETLLYLSNSTSNNVMNLTATWFTTQRNATLLVYVFQDPPTWNEPRLKQALGIWNLPTMIGGLNPGDFFLVLLILGIIGGTAFVLLGTRKRRLP